MTQEGVYFDPSRDAEPDLKFILTIRLGNDQMRTLIDIARAFADMVNKYPGSGDVLEELDGARIQDVNGNTVGSWTVQEVHV